MSSEWLFNYLIIFSVAGVISYLAGFIITFLAKRLGAIDKPNQHKIHQHATPRLGGVGIFLGFAGSLFLAYKISLCSLSPIIGYLILGSFITMVIGAIDDLTARRGGVPSVIKLVILFGITYILSQSGIIVNFPFPYFLNLIITLIWLVAITSAFNAMDNMDGLASGLALIASLTFLAVAIQTNQWNWGVLAVALVGANLGFLRHNFYPAKLFMGDSGSFFLGFTLAAMGIMGAWSTNPFKASSVPIIILGLPLIDLVYVVIKRQRQGLTHTLREIIVYSGQDHFSHRLKALGFSYKQTVLLIYLISFCFSCSAFILRNTRRWEAVLLLFQFILIMGIIFLLISRLIPRQDIK